MTDHPYTDNDLRAEAARQHATLTDDPDLMGVGEQMEYAWVPSVETTEDGSARTWKQLLVVEDETGDDEDYTAFGEAQRKIHDLIQGAADVSEWAVSLGAAGLTRTVSMGWYVTGSGWDLAVQIAHLPGIKPEVCDEIESAVRLAVERVFREHGLVPRGLDTSA
ncbi:hypothetical protein ACIQFU_22950 [Streptomyces sp. NPDC093065]|uniref:hypothetical protein n=1 Tax=Streptomyces sp. NPDC093065 TaxID=3366021 RepID=UPI00382718E3